METAPQTGSVLGERYRLIRPLARGGMGSVWRAEHLALNSEVAVKIIDPRVAHHDMGVPRFLREARALAALHSPYIVQVIDFGSHGETVYLVMELLEGRTLGQRLKAGGRLSPGETCRIFRDVCKAMNHAHDRGIVHRDLKPDNIFLCDESREHVTKVLDFGIAKPTKVDAASQNDTGAGAFLGTPSYMSPEQCRGFEVDQRSDLWALGAIAYECLVGKRLFAGEAVGEIVLRICAENLPAFGDLTHLPPGFAAWLHTALARNPAERFQSAPLLFEALSSVLDVSGQPTPGVDSAETLSGTLESAGEQVLPSKPPSTLAHGSLENDARGTSRAKRPTLRVVAGTAVVLAVSALVVLLRLRAAAPGTELESLASSDPATSAAPGASVGGAIASTSHRPPLDPPAGARAAGGARNDRADAGAGAGDSANEPPYALSSARPDKLERPPAASGPRQLAAPAKRSPARRKTSDEMEMLRRKR